ncbi:hypothetical protein SRHO_G00311870 [Serrasalmus rhombeus]
MGEGSTCFLTCEWSNTAALTTALQQCFGQETGLLHASENRRPTQAEQSLRDCGLPRLLSLGGVYVVSSIPTSGLFWSSPCIFLCASATEYIVYLHVGTLKLRSVRHCAVVVEPVPPAPQPHHHLSQELEEESASMESKL